MLTEIKRIMIDSPQPQNEPNPRDARVGIGKRRGLLGKTAEHVLENESLCAYNERLRIITEPEQYGPRRNDRHYDLTRNIS